MARRYDAQSPARLLMPESIDGDLLAEAHRRLRSAGYAGFQRIQCHVDDEGVLTLRGTVASYYLKQRAFHVVADVNGVRRVSNEIAVESGWVGR